MFSMQICVELIKSFAVYKMLTLCVNKIINLQYLQKQIISYKVSSCNYS